MDDQALSSVIFEHACKKDFKNTIERILNTEDFVSALASNISNTKKKQVKPVFMLIYMLRNLNSSNILFKIDSMSEKITYILPILIDLLCTTFRQCCFISLKKFFTLISELKLLDLLNSIVRNLDSSQILLKLNQHFPRWTSTYRATMEKDFSIESSKILDKVEESHAQCRRLVLKLAVDLTYRSKYMSEQYTSDIERIVKESREYMKEAFTTLQSFAGSSSLEMLVENEENVSNAPNLEMQLLLEYIQPKITDDALVRFLDDLEPTLNTKPTTGLSSCLLPFDSMSEYEDSDASESEYEFSESGSQPMNSQENKSRLNGY